jgi:hypothetical protein
MKNQHWKSQFLKIAKQEDSDAVFAPRHFFDNDTAIKYLNSLEKIGADITLNTNNMEIIYIKLPTELKDREKILMHILTSIPLPTDVYHDQKKNILELCWS